MEFRAYPKMLYEIGGFKGTVVNSREEEESFWASRPPKASDIELPDEVSPVQHQERREALQQAVEKRKRGRPRKIK